MITENNIKMFKLLSMSLHDSNDEIIDLTNEWKEIQDELMIQTVYALPFGCINNVLILEEDKKQYFNFVLMHILHFQKVMEQQEQVLKIFQEAMLPVVVLKGAAAAINYPHPEYRTMGDIDLIVHPDDYRRAFELMVSAGYKPEEEFSFDSRHVEFDSPYGIRIEVHRCFSNESDPNPIIDKYVVEKIANCVIETVNGKDIPLLPPLENGLVLLTHIAQHLERGLGLRQIIDWYCFVEKYINDEFWHTEFQNAVDKIGLTKLAIVTTAMCKKYFGSSANYTWCDVLGENDAELCDLLMEYILDHGNFGRKKTETNEKMMMSLRLFKSPIEGFKKAQQFGCENWELLHKFPRLRPFAWIYQSYRWVKHVKATGMGVHSFKEYVHTEKKETEFLHKLEVYRKH